SALHVASYCNLPTKVAKILSSGEEKNSTDTQLWTPLHWACLAKAKRPLTFSFLTVNTNAKDSVGWTPLFWAALNLLAVRLLLEAGAEVSFAAKQTPLHKATFRRGVDFTEIVFKHGAHLEARDAYGLTPLQQAILNGFEKTSKLLPENGANVN
ncbi:ankyrin, partial [Colletotrichum caudatum]